MRQMEKETSDLRKQVEILDNSKRTLEDEIVLLCREKECSEKMGKYTDKVMKGVREKTDTLETKLSDAQQKLSHTIEQMALKTEMIRNLESNKVKLEKASDELNKELDQVEVKVIRAQAQIDKKQNLVDLRQKTIVALEEGCDKKSHINPMELEIQRLKSELEATNVYNNESKSQWLKHQQDIVDKSQKRSELSEDVLHQTRRFLVMKEKAKKLEIEIEVLAESVEKMRRKIEAKDGQVKRMSAQQFQEQEKYDKALFDMETKKAKEADVVTRMIEDLSAMKGEIDSISKEIEKEKALVLESDAMLHDWEEKVRDCKETWHLINKQKGREGEMEQMRAELHRLQVRYNIIYIKK